jgi:D-aminoacyl-tRNA deacylase
MFKKFLIIASKQDQAGINIINSLRQFKIPNTALYLINTDIIEDKGIDQSKLEDFDFVIFASKHESSQGGKTLSIHAPGNWRKAELGGKDEKLCPTSALFQKFAFEKLNSLAKQHFLDNYEITLECTHHGPLIHKPCLFIEIGATENQWKDKRAAFVIAKTIKQTIEEFKPNPYNEVAVGIGGPHYCPVFNKVQLNSNVALSHIIPQYVLPIKEENLKEAIKKTIEEVDFVLIDWKGVGNSEAKNQLLEILDKNHITYKKTKEIKK